jgi:hypothetical protein
VKVFSERQARASAKIIKSGLANLEAELKRFHAYMGWLPLGYHSFTEWWDNELGNVPLATGLRNWAIFAMTEEAPRSTYTGNLAHGTVPAVAQAMGVSPHMVRNVIHQNRQRQRSRLTGKSDDDTVQIGLGVPNLWRKRIVQTASERKVSMADLLRPVIADGMKSRYGVDVDQATSPKPTTRLAAATRR